MRTEFNEMIMLGPMMSLKGVNRDSRFVIHCTRLQTISTQWKQKQIQIQIDFTWFEISNSYSTI